MFAVLVLALAFGTSPWDHFEVLRVRQFGCQIQEIAPEHQWHVNVWASYSEPSAEQSKDYQLVYSVRGDEFKAMKDCRAWMKEVRKRIAPKKKRR